jgi:hypothetical protein
MSEEIWKCRGCGEAYTNEELEQLPETEIDLPDGSKGDRAKCENGCEELIVLTSEDGSILTGPGKNIQAAIDSSSTPGDSE